MSAVSLFDVLDEPRPGREHLSVWNGSDFTTLTWDDWRARGAAAAGRLRQLGVRPGSRVGCLLTNRPEVCAGVLGVWMAGGTVVSMPVIARGMSPEAYMEQIRAVRTEVGADVVLMETQYRALLDPDALGGRSVAYEDLAGPPLREPTPPSDDEVAFIQYSSGATSDAKGCMLTGRAIRQQLVALAEALSLDPKVDRGAAWLPLSHDMGFFGGLMQSFWNGIHVAVGSPERFLRAPGSWARDWVAFDANLTAAPNFALDLLARRKLTSDRAPLPMRKLVIGGERVEPSTLARVRESLGPAGFDSTSLTPAYGLAECVLAVTMKPLGEEPRLLTVAREPLADGRLEVVDAEAGPETTTLVSSGRPVGDAELRIDGDGDGGVGEICVRSSNLTCGYVNRPDLDGERLADGELRTGDAGFLHDGELYVTGRLDDMLSVHGRNLYARDIEVALTDAEAGIRRGTCVLLGLANGGGPTRVLLLSESAQESASRRELDRLAERIAEAALRETGIHLDECAFVARGRLPKTPSGKVKRFRCRELLERDGDEILARVRV
jgi:acyl-CoA synthetase (AMP-forming)/AMP-acid ligase II